MDKTTFRSLRPASSTKRPDAGSHAASSSDETGTPVPGSSRTAAIQACLDCRRLKIKCDGNRPKCSTCTVKKRSCGYVGHEGQSRATAVKSRLESLEGLVATLKTSSPAQLSTILNDIRGADDAVGAIESLASQTETVSLDGRSRQHALLLLLADEQALDLRLVLPEASVVKRAVESFFSCSGKLFHVFSEAFILLCHEAVFGAAQDASDFVKARVCCLAAVAAVGAQYAPDVFGKDVEAGLYNLARHLLEVAMEHEPLHAIKACALLAQYNIMNKEMMSLTYVEMGLGMCHFHGINNRETRPESIPSQEWRHVRHAWRTLVFFSSWLSATLGYISRNPWSPSKRVFADLKFDDPANITEVVQGEMVRICLLKADILRMHLVFEDLSGPAVEAITRDLQDWYQELPESMRLGASVREGVPVGTRRSILHLHMLYLGAIMLLHRRIASQFLKWYAVRGCPSSLDLTSRYVFVQQSAEAVLAASTSARIVKLLLDDDGVFKHCWLVIFQSYTACTILLHSVIQKQLHDFEPPRWQDDLDRAGDCLSVLAFCGSRDRVAAQFHEQLQAIFETVSVYGFNSSPCQALMEMDFQHSPPKSDGDFIPTDLDGYADYSYLLDIPPEAEESLRRLSLVLLMMLSQPFGDLGTKEAAERDLKGPWLAYPSRYEYPQLASRVDWDLGSRTLFSWDMSGLNVPPLDVTAAAVPVPGQSGSAQDAPRLGLLDGQARGTFLGSSEPSGWASAASLTNPVTNQDDVLRE
ncbi:nitrate assimilation regulatory protein nirA [Metarhizium album ARSEF 1941]|uniref:Nitrate assimilation regulatory protein nirA n=1 Tax=Metarhizium album (strain ARSEF 1941) TaxID=1081103 RepID=A0A0B2X4M9_METAS|nr:nitrate assimilation regulatory protein nirA [Metarhizium album ARSEF 1941]KHO01294.1 nitrate assimilation regulatory protein nirA [Metarhizium album ARSEF 1941]